MSAATVLHVVWSRVLAAVSGRDDVVSSAPSSSAACRRATARATTCPACSSTPSRRAPARRGTDVAQAVHAMHHQLAELVVHEHASLAVAQRAGGVRPPAPLFTAVLNYRHNPAGGGPARSCRPARSSSPSRSAPTTRCSSPSTTTAGRSPSTSRRPPRSTPDLVTRLLHATTERVVDALEQAPDTPLADVDVLPAAERHRVLTEWNDTGRPDTARTLADLLADRAAATHPARATRSPTTTTARPSSSTTPSCSPAPTGWPAT